MLRTAGEEYFENNPQPDLYDEFKQVVKNTSKYVERRNDIAHGVVSGYTPSAGKPVSGLALLPPRYATKKHEKDFNWPMVTKPTYAYTSAEIMFFYNEFKSISPLASRLFTKIYRFFEGSF